MKQIVCGAFTILIFVLKTLYATNIKKPEPTISITGIAFWYMSYNEVKPNTAINT